MKSHAFWESSERVYIHHEGLKSVLATCKMQEAIHPDWTEECTNGQNYDDGLLVLTLFRSAVSTANLQTIFTLLRAELDRLNRVIAAVEALLPENQPPGATPQGDQLMPKTEALLRQRDLRTSNCDQRCRSTHGGQCVTNRSGVNDLVQPG